MKTYLNAAARCNQPGVRLPGVRQLDERAVDERTVDRAGLVRDREHHVASELATDHGRDLSYRLRAAQTVEPRKQRALQGGRDLEDHAVDGGAMIGGFEHRLAELLEEQGVAAGTLDDPVGSCAAGDRLRQEGLHHLVRLLFVQRLEGDHVDVREIGPRERELGSRRRQ